MNTEDTQCPECGTPCTVNGIGQYSPTDIQLYAEETAAERDRLKEKNEALYNALRKVRAELDWFKSGRLPVMDRCQKICEEAMDNNKH